MAMAYIVPGVRLIRQTKTMACWYASAQMLIQWRRNQTQSSEIGMPDPSEEPTSVSLERANNGLTDLQVITLATSLGLMAVPPMSPTPDALEGWLKSYGPLWVNGRTHIVVIGGISTGSLYIYDPAPSVTPDP